MNPGLLYATPPSHALCASILPLLQVLPVERGAGLSQFGMQLARDRLAAGDWVHIFPEGTRSRSGKMGPVRCAEPASSCRVLHWICLLPPAGLGG